MKKLAVANGTYPKDGQEKTRWVNVGVILEKNGKEFMLIDPTINFAAFPREQGKDMVMVGIFDDSQGQQQNQSYQQPQQNQSYAPQQQQQNYQAPHGQVPVHQEQVPQNQQYQQPQQQ